MPSCGEEKYRQHLQDWHNVTVSEELERAVAVAKDRVGEEQGGRTPAKLSKEGAVKTGGAAEGRKGRTTPNKGGRSTSTRSAGRWPAPTTRVLLATRTRKRVNCLATPLKNSVQADESEKYS